MPQPSMDEMERRLLALLQLREGATERTVHEMLAYLEQRNSVAEMARLIEAGRVDELIADLDRAGIKIAEQVTATYYLAARQAAQLITEVTLAPLTFDQTQLRAVNQVQANRLELVREFTNGQRAAVREVLADGVQRGLNPIATAREVRSSLGLTAEQARYVSNYRRQLEQGDRGALQRELRDRRSDRKLDRAFKAGQPLPKADVDRMVEAYRQRWVNFRAQVISRTESLRAVHQGTEEMWQQAVDAGEVDPDDIVRTWRTAMDPRVRHSHRMMNGQKRALGVPFLSGYGNAIRFPCDPQAPASETVQCRCVVVTRIIPGGGAALRQAA